jgi:hypothetical protein
MYDKTAVVLDKSATVTMTGTRHRKVLVDMTAAHDAKLVECAPFSRIDSNEMNIIINEPKSHELLYNLSFTVFRHLRQQALFQQS